MDAFLGRRTLFFAAICNEISSFAVAEGDSKRRPKTCPWATRNLPKIDEMGTENQHKNDHRLWTSFRSNVGAPRDPTGTPRDSQGPQGPTMGQFIEADEIWRSFSGQTG